MATAMDDDAVMRKILWRLPLKALVRLKCVSKHWYALITSLQNQNNVLVKRQVRKEGSGAIETIFSIFQYPFFTDESCLGPEFQHSSVHGCSHGIVCFSNNTNDVFLYNPFTRELRKLPPSILLFPDILAFQSSVSSSPPFMINTTLPWNPSMNYTLPPFQGGVSSSPPFINNTFPHFQASVYSSPPFMNNTLPNFQGAPSINNTLPPFQGVYSSPPFMNNTLPPFQGAPSINNTLPPFQGAPSINNTLPPFQGVYSSLPFMNNTLPPFQGAPSINNTLPPFQGAPSINNTLPPFQPTVYPTPPYFQGFFSTPSPIPISPDYNLPSQQGVDSHTIGLGFGYDHKSRDFKVVRIVDFYAHSQDTSRPHRAEVYDLGKDRWREIKTPIPASPAHLNSFDISYQGCYYWWATGFRDVLILWFHFSKEVFGTISMPEGLSHGKIFTTLAVLNESIVLFNYPCVENERSFDLWKLVKDDDDHHGPEVVSWTKLFTIGPLLGVDRPLGFVSFDELLMVDNEGQLILCNIFNTQHCKRLPVKGKLTSFQALLFVKTTLSLKGGGHS